MTNAVTQDGFAAPLFDDNPAILDLLGFDAVAEVVAEVVTAGGLDPATVGIHSAWGGGKSTALNLIADRLGSESMRWNSTRSVISVALRPGSMYSSMMVRPS